MTFDFKYMTLNTWKNNHEKEKKRKIWGRDTATGTSCWFFI